MGLIECLLVGIAGITTVLVGVGLAIGRGAPQPRQHVALPVAALIASVVAALAGGGLSVALSGPFTEALLGRASSGNALVLTGPRDLVLAQVHGAVLLASCLALPGLCAAAWLLISRERSLRGAAALALAGGLGAAAGIGLGWFAIEGLFPSADLDTFSAVQLGVLQLAEAGTKALLCFSAAGASLGVLWWVSQTSAEALHRSLWGTVALPFLALSIGAITTPPDLFTQLLAASIVALGWIGGLGIGAATGWLRGSLGAAG